MERAVDFDGAVSKADRAGLEMETSPVSGAVEQEYHLSSLFHLRLRYSRPGGKVVIGGLPRWSCESFDRFYRLIPVPHASPPFLPVSAVVKTTDGACAHFKTDSEKQMQTGSTPDQLQS